MRVAPTRQRWRGIAEDGHLGVLLLHTLPAAATLQHHVGVHKEQVPHHRHLLRPATATTVINHTHCGVTEVGCVPAVV